MKKRIYILVCLMWSVAFYADAQIDKADVRKGNRDFKRENYREAEIDYRKALVKDSLSVAANYNLANTLYKEGDMDNALKALERIKDVVPETSSADYWYNLGDVAIARQDWQGAVDAFRKSLLMRPDDLDAKENYIYARKKLQDQQNQQNQDDQNNQNNQDDQNQQDQNQDNRNDDQKDRQDEKNQDNDQNGGQDQPKEKPQQGQQPKITPQAAQQMLQAIQAKEKETQDKVNKQKAEALKARQKDKNW